MFAGTYPSKPAEALTREQALIAFTQGLGALRVRGSREGHPRGRQAGRSRCRLSNIFEVPSQALPATEAVLTVVGRTIIRDTRLARDETRWRGPAVNVAGFGSEGRRRHRTRCRAPP
jgi:hypothetical protein